MTLTISEQKAQLRKTCRSLRRGLDPAFREQASRLVCAEIENWDIFQQAQVILGYMPTNSEVDLRPLLEQHPGKTWALPRILPGENHRMIFHVYDPARLSLHPFGMAEPQADLAVIPPGEIDLALVPGLAFDLQGWRLGYGGGYFDRFLKDFHGVSLGVNFEALLRVCEELPHDPHDMPMQWLASEQGLYPARVETSSPSRLTARSVG
jgi:5-formyltetrahydrofolate cyclo-ligase